MTLIGNCFVEFSQSVYNDSESSGHIIVTLLLRGDICTEYSTVIVVLSDQSPTSAEGKKSLSKTNQLVS